MNRSPRRSAWARSSTPWRTTSPTGWACIAVQSTDKSGNTSVSPPLRVYINNNGSNAGKQAQPLGLGAPPACTGSYDKNSDTVTPGAAARAGSTSSSTSYKAVRRAGRAILRAGMTLPAVAVESLAQDLRRHRGGRRSFVRGRAGRDLRPARAQRRGQDDDAADAGRHPAAHARAACRLAGLDVVQRPAGGAPAPRLPDQHDRPLPAPLGARAARATSRGCTAWRPPPPPRASRRSRDALRPRGAFYDRRCEALSTGERQRLSDRPRRLARSGGADPGRADRGPGRARRRASCATSSRAERDRGKAVVFSTHYLAEAELLCDRIGLLHRGRLLAEGTPAALRARGRRRAQPGGGVPASC